MALAAVSACLFLAAGCGAGSSSFISSQAVASTTGTISGKALGGRQPIAQATILLCEAGYSGYGSGTCNTTTNIAMTPTKSDGSFTIPTYNCPTTTGLLYLKASGGITVTGGSNNANAVLMAAIGPCNQTTTPNLSVNIDEATTVGSMFALAQFFNPTNETFGTSNTVQGLTGLTNAFATVNNLVNYTSGTAIYPSQTVPGTGSLSSASVTITPDAAKINTIANILSACINDSSPYTNTCVALYANVGGSPTDTLQALYYMATNPSSGGATNIANILAVAGTSGPYQTPAQLSTVNDWTIGLTYLSESNTGTGTPYILGGPELLAVDGGGNVWIANYNGSTSGTPAAPAYGSLTKLSPTGTPLLNVLNTGQIIYPAGIVIDPNNNVYVSDYETKSGLTTVFDNQVVEYTAAGLTNSFTIGNGPGQMVSDSLGDIFVVETSSTVNSVAGPGQLEEIPVANPTSPVAIGSTGQKMSKNSGIVMDQWYNIWIGGAGNSSSVFPYVYSNSGSPTWTEGTPSAPPCANKGYGAAIDSNSNIWLPSGGLAAGAICEVKASSSATISGPSTAYSGGGLEYPYYIAVDGGGNLWVSNDTTAEESVSAFTNSGTALSPSGGFTTSTFWEPYMIAVDPSGNVWLGNYNSPGTASIAGCAPGSSVGVTPYGCITEIVGAAVPVVTPIAAGLPSTAGGTMKIGTRP
jgi:hypothetical protein